MESFGHKVIKKLTRHSAPSTCKVEPTEITTFDGKNYRYTINDCEHVVFAEESSRPRVVVSNKKTQKMHVVSMIVDGEKYIVEIPRENRHESWFRTGHRSPAEPAYSPPCTSRPWPSWAWSWARAGRFSSARSGSSVSPRGKEYPW